MKVGDLLWHDCSKSFCIYLGEAGTTVTGRVSHYHIYHPTQGHTRLPDYYFYTLGQIKTRWADEAKK